MEKTLMGPRVKVNKYALGTRGRHLLAWKSASQMGIFKGGSIYCWEAELD